MGHPTAYKSAEDVFNEIAKVSALYQGLTYAEIEGGDCLWPYHDHGRPSTPDRKLPAVSRSRVDFADSEIYLAIEKPLFHSGTLSRRSKALKTILPEPLLRMSPRHAEALGLEPGDRALVKTERGSFTLPVAVDAAVRDNRVFMSNHFAGRGVFELFGLEMDEVTKAPGLDGWPVQIEKDGE
jgi:predicted molibdopterin-dependent oxidoreductase YjgC